MKELKIFWVDDDEFFLGYIKRLFVNYSADPGMRFELWVADNVTEALPEIPVLKPDVVLTNLVMPHMSGFDFVEMIRRKYPSIMIVVVSSRDQPSDIEEARKAGADLFISKSAFRIDHLVGEMVREVGKKRYLAGYN